MQIINKSKEILIAQRGKLANTFFTRMMGLLNRDSIDPDEALIIIPCKSIHMFFMRFPIDVVFVDKELKVVGMVENIQPFRLSPTYRKAGFAIELAVGSVQRLQIQIGDSIQIIDE